MIICRTKMNMRYFLQSIASKRSFIEKNKYLGRWTIDYCEKRIEKKVKWSNEDHCGSCSTLQLTTICQPSYFPVEPKPPSPRKVSGSESTILTERIHPISGATI